MLLSLYGTDSYRIQQAIAATIARYQTIHGSSLEVVRIDGSEESAYDELQRQLKYPSFFHETRLIIVSHAASEAVGNILEEHALAQLPDIVFVAVQDTSLKGFDKKILAKLIRTSSSATEYEPLIGPALFAWMSAYCEPHLASLSSETARLLATTVGPDTRAIAHELDKLIAYAQGKPLDASMVETLTPRRLERDEWELSNALAVYDKRSVMVALWRKLQEGTAEQLLLGSLASSLRNLLMIKDLLNRQKAPGVIATATGLHPFVVSKTLSGARKIDATRLAHAHIALAHLDREAKDGRMDMIDGLFSILLAL